MTKVTLGTGALCLLWSATIMSIFGLSGSIESDMTIKNPEKFAPGKLIPEYFNKTAKQLLDIKNDKTLNLANIQKKKNDKRLREKITKNITLMKTISDRLAAISRRLKYATGSDYYNVIKSTYFKDLKRLKDQANDPFNILKLDDQNLELNRDFLYRFLAWNLPGQKTTAQIRAMPYKNIWNEIDSLRTNKAHDSYFFLLREIGAFFKDELEKEEYDAFIDGPAALDRLIIPTKAKRDAFNERLDTLLTTLAQLSLKMNEAQQTIS